MPCILFQMIQLVVASASARHVVSAQRAKKFGANAPNLGGTTRHVSPHHLHRAQIPITRLSPSLPHASPSPSFRFGLRHIPGAWAMDAPPAVPRRWLRARATATLGRSKRARSAALGGGPKGRGERRAGAR
eukprot:scaffold15277_cov34-Tisochrysis_lutea.AAC.4